MVFSCEVSQYLHTVLPLKTNTKAIKTVLLGNLLDILCGVFFPAVRCYMVLFCVAVHPVFYFLLSVVCTE